MTQTHRLELDEWLSVGEAAERLGVSVWVLRRADKSGVLVADRTPGGHRRYRASDVDALLAAKRIAT